MSEQSLLDKGVQHMSFQHSSRSDITGSSHIPASRIIVKSPDGDVVACWTSWLAEVNRAGLLEPPPPVRPPEPATQASRCGRCAAQPAAAGATVAQIGTSGDAAGTANLAAGVRPWSRKVTYRRRVTP